MKIKGLKKNANIYRMILPFVIIHTFWLSTTKAVLPDSVNWKIFEINIDGTGLREVSHTPKDVDCFEPCYLPDGRIIFNSNAGFQGEKCVKGGSFLDRPERCHVYIRHGFPAWQNLHHTGFRIVINE